VLPSFVFLYGHADPFIRLLFTDSYAESVQVFQIYLWLVPLHMLVLSPIPQIFGRTRVNLYVVLVMSAVMIVSSYVLLQWVGFYGPAIANVGSQYFGVALYFIVVMRLTRASLFTLLPIVDLMRVVLVSLVALLAARLFPDLGVSGLSHLLLAGGAFSVVFLGVAAATGVFTPADYQLVKRWMAKALLGVRR